MDKTSFIVVTICVILLYFTWNPKAPTVAPQQQTTSQTETSVNTPSTPAPTQKVETTQTVTAKIADLPIQTIENDAMILTFDAQGRGIATAELKEHKAEKVEGNYIFDAANSPLFAVKSTLSSEIKKEGDSVQITGYLAGSTVKLVRTFTLNKENPYLLNGELEIVNTGNSAVLPGALLINAGTMTALDPKSDGFVYGGDNNQQVSFKEKDGDVDEETLGSIKKMESSEKFRSDDVDWIAVENRYFCTVLTPSNSFDGFLMETADTDVKDAKVLSGFGQLSIGQLAPGQKINVKFDAYVGPKQYSYLSTLGQDQEDILDLGWAFIRPMSKLVLKLLGILSGIGYGLAIILITVLIKTLFWPITHKSQVSMRKMSELQPIIKEIKAKYKDNPQMMQMKTMEAYKANKVNPLGGCLPMFIQIPVFFALYSTFRSAVELRHVSFLWCSDLAKPDTIGTIFSLAINPLALIMVFSMLAQQMLTPTTGDPNQKKMMMFMPLIMLIFMYNMPAALTLYWTVNQLISIIQQYYTNRAIKKTKQA